MSQYSILVLYAKDQGIIQAMKGTMSFMLLAQCVKAQAG